MRFFSSSALASAPKLRFAASCSAAETIIFGFLSRAPAALNSVPDPQQPPDIIWYPVSISPLSRKANCPPGGGQMTQMLRRFALFLGRRQDLDRAARLLDRRDGGLGSAVRFDRQLGLELAAAEQPQAALRPAQHAGLDQRFHRDRVLGVDRLRVDRILQPVEID